MPRLRVVILVLFSMAPSRPGLARDGGLESQLRAEDPSYLVRASRLQGDARRGAILFHRPSSGCIICHSVAGHGGHVGPDLARPRPDLDPQGAIEAILNPSKSIAPGFETMILSLTDGRVLSALLVDDRPDRLVLRDAARPDPLIEVAKDTIEERRASELSAMPEGLVNTLADRQSFLDLARYVIEITEGGAPRARLLEPDQAALAPPPLPDYEHTLDHARLISGWGPDSLRRGEEIYARVCANCHGTPERPGSLPSSLRFWSDRFRNGSDPYRMYQTLTLGFDQMAAQSWMTPRAKYDVIHYIRETYLSSRNPDQFTVADGAYLATLPKGNALGPDSPSPTPWKDMNYSPVFAGSIEVGSDRSNIAYKGLALRLDDGPGGVARGRAWALYELDTLRVAGFWTGEDFIDWESIQLNGRHEVHPHTVGDVVLANPNLPGWKHPTEPMREDARLKGRDGVRYGPLPRDWVQLLGRYQHGNDTILAYAVGQTRILERPGIAKNPARPEVPIFTRTFEIDARSSELVARLGPATVSYSLSTCNGARIQLENDFAFLHIASSKATRHVTVFMTAMPQGELDSWAPTAPQTQALESFTHGAPPLWPEPVLVAAAAVSTEGPFHVADLSLPSANPWKALVRPTGFDFLDEGKKAAVCTWDGDVWLVDLVDQITGALTWRRIATGLYQPLGLLVRDGVILVSCRDQIVALRDLNGDSFIDFYETINSEHQVTEHFHEFAMGLQADDTGNLYYAKAARHALPALVPHHGTLLRVSADRSRTDILATGFRAPNGVCLNPDGTFFVTDQEGHWNPKNRLNLVRTDRFYGNMWAYSEITDTSDSAMDQPVCWITNAFDRSPSEPLWVTSDNWGELKGSLLSLSYGYGRVFLALTEEVDGQMQGGLVPLPIPPLPTGLVRGRFHPSNGQLYVCGMFAWAGNQTQPGGFYRIQRTQEPLNMPTRMHARNARIELTFSDPLDPAASADTRRWSVGSWNLSRTANYGSPHVGEHELNLQRVEISDDRRTAVLELPELEPAQGLEIRYSLLSAKQDPVDGAIHATIHRLP